MDKKLRNRILFTLGMLSIYLFGTNLTVPTVNANISTESLGFLNTLSLLGGGSLEKMSIFSMGVGPYITAGIVIQLLSMDVIPTLNEWTKDGENGKRKIEKTTRYLGFVLAFVQALSLTYGFDKQYHILESGTFSSYMFVTIVLTAGSMVLVWLGDMISKRGIGSGMSLIIVTGIISRIPATLFETLMILGDGFNALVMFTLYVLAYLLVIVAVIVVEKAVKKISLQSTKTSTMTTGGNINHLPLKLNNASVIPVILAQAVLSAPMIMLSFINYGWYEKLNKYLSLTHPVGLTIYAVLIIVFCFFYTYLQMDPKKMSENLKKSHMFIPGIRQGEETTKYLKDTLNKLTTAGSILLVILALIPFILTKFINISTVSALGGTGVILIVGIALETVEQIKQQNTEKNYRGLLYD